LADQHLALVLVISWGAVAASPLSGSNARVSGSNVSQG
jgi:hypothetical protein